MNKQKLFSLNAKNFRWDYYRGTGKGGQKRNKVSSACRCFHLESGSVGTCEDYREQYRNKREAFKRCTGNKKFKEWLRVEISKQTGEYVRLEEEVDKMMNEKFIKIEIGDHFDK